MKFDTSNIVFSRPDNRRNIILPSYLTQKLSNYIGIHIGDGYLNINKRKNSKSVDYNIEYTGHEVDEIEFHEEYIVPLIRGLFNIEPYLRIGNKTTVRTYFRSKAILTFLKEVIGIPKGNKRDIEVPPIIINSNLKMKKSFLKGLFDTEGSMVFKKRYREKHYYPTISIGSQSKNLIKVVKVFLDEIGIKSCVCYNLRNYRNGKVNFEHQIDISGRKNLDIWMDKIGFNSSKHLTKYDVWKKFGFCPPNTNIIERRKILKGVVDINSYYGPVAQPG